MWHLKSRFAVHYHLQQEKLYFLTLNVSRDSSVIIATSYSPDGPGIETRWGRDFTFSSKPTLEHLRPSVHWVPGLFRGGKADGTWYWPPITSSIEIKQSADICLPPSEALRPFLGWTLNLTLNANKIGSIKNITLLRVRVTIFPMEMQQNLLHILLSYMSFCNVTVFCLYKIFFMANLRNPQ